MNLGDELYFFFKQKTANGLRISDWSSDVCSSDLFVLTDAEDEASLEQAFGQLNASATSLLATVNEELAARSEPPLESAGALVYQAGLTYLRQRRFDALKQAVNANHAVVATAADLLAEAAPYIYRPTLGENQVQLEKAENMTRESNPEPPTDDENNTT